MSTQTSVPTGLLSDSQRAFLRGERDEEIENPGNYESKIRHDANQRVEQMVEDLELLEARGHDDIVAKFYYRINRIERLRRAIDADLPDNREQGGEEDDSI